MAIPPRKPSIQRISEGESTRQISGPSNTAKVGKTCVGCKRYYNYIKKAEKLCISCKSRHHDLNK